VVDRHAAVPAVCPTREHIPKVDELPRIALGAVSLQSGYPPIVDAVPNWNGVALTTLGILALGLPQVLHLLLAVCNRHSRLLAPQTSTKGVW
jgi:hypothetical protein